MASTNIDPYEHLKISLNPDGTLTRVAVFPDAPPSDDLATPVTSADIILDPHRQTRARIYLPRHRPSIPNLLPVILYVHGGGFIMLSAATAPFHHTCSQIAAALPAIVLSVDYRLAPEHPLPAAYDDAVDALLWARRQALDPTTPYTAADWSRCFLTGTSAGANIAYHAAARAASLDLAPVSVAGLVLDQPFFGGAKRTEAEVRMADDLILPLPVTDLMWELALPRGAGREHEYCDFRKAEAPAVGRCLVRGHGGDPLIDRQRAVAAMMERSGVEVVTRFRDGGFHGVEIYRPKMAAVLLADVKDFVTGGDGGSGARL